jgi:DNA-3-methyladenine glycosylase II
LPEEKVERMHGIARAALDGLLDAARLQAMGPEAALVELQKLHGIGPFYSSLIVVRATGFADVLPQDEPIMRGLVARLYRLPAEPTPAEMAELAHGWRPMRTWVTVLVRVAGPRILDGARAVVAAEA